MMPPMVRFYAVFGAAAISFSAILVRLADTSPSTAAFFRPFYALPLLALAWWFTREGDARSRRNRLLALGAGMLTGVAFTLWNHAIGFIGAGLSTVLGNTQVVFVGLLAWLLYGERPSNTAFVAVPLVFAGVVLASGLGRADAYGAAPLLGAGLSLANALVYTAFLLIFRAVSGAVKLPTGPLLDATAGAAVAALLLGALTDPAFSLLPSWPAHGWLLLLAFGSQTVGWLCIMVALPRLPALETSVILLLQPALAVVWALWIFQEFLSPLQWAGVVLVLAGVGVLSLAGSVRGAQRPATAD